MSIIMLSNSTWIKSPVNKAEACYEFYTDFTLCKPVARATLAVTAMGMYRAFINDSRVTNELYTPYWTEYTKRLQYQIYDVTELIQSENALNFICAEGWAVGYVRAGAEHRNHYADHISLIYALEIIFTDGTKAYINSDENTKVRTSHIVSSSIYHGEFVDKTALVEELGYALNDDSVHTHIIVQQGEKVTEQDIIYPRELIETPSGEKVIDFGQNLSGYVEVKICGKRGDKVIISHAEILDKYGNFYTDNLRSARQQNTYVLSGDGMEIFKPSFTWQGFRYIRLDSYPYEDIDLSSFRAIAVHSDIKRTGDFVCGHPKLNQLYHNIVWGQKSNFIDVPTDCPQRDERLGWTGDAQVFVRTAAINFDVERFFEKWLADLAAGQMPDGSVGWLVPDCNLQYRENVSSAWGDAATICPWEIYMAYGNKKILQNQFESMQKWVDYIRNTGDDEYLWQGGKQFGDWLAMDNEDGSYNGATPYDYISTAYYAYSTSLLIKSGNVLGYDMSEYVELYHNIVSAFQREFIKDDLPAAHTQTAYAIALYFNLCTDREKTAAELSKMIRDNGNKLTTGFVGTPYLLHALSDNGYADTAYDLLLQEQYPSWLYSVGRGATTMWEHWDGIKEDGSFWDKAMNSYNHYAYGAVYDWIFGVAAGIRPLDDGAGYKHCRIEPHPDKRIGFLKSSIETRRGHLSSYWYYTQTDIKFEFDIPADTIAEIILPDGRRECVLAGRYIYSTVDNTGGKTNEREQQN